MNSSKKQAEVVADKEKWESPRLFELDFSETKLGKNPDGFDGDPPTRGNLKIGS